MIGKLKIERGDIALIRNDICGRGYGIDCFLRMDERDGLVFRIGDKRVEICAQIVLFYFDKDGRFLFIGLISQPLIGKKRIILIGKHKACVFIAENIENCGSEPCIGCKEKGDLPRGKPR